jgi:hypothetical protein
MARVISHIGHWAQRIYEPSNYRNTLGHLVESEIADRVVTHCGRQMQWHTDAKAANFLRFTVDRPDVYCLNCVR